MENTPMQNSPHTNLTRPVEGNSRIASFIVELLSRTVIVLSATLTLAAVAAVA
jgi:hypothetical protein